MLEYKNLQCYDENVFKHRQFGSVNLQTIKSVQVSRCWMCFWHLFYTCWTLFINAMFGWVERKWRGSEKF